jgi:ABC-type cobalt transport system substrate-binding protein
VRERKIVRSGIIFFAMFAVVALIALPVVTGFAAEKWQGVDETVVKKIAREHGREPGEPLINTEQGDLPLFLFLLAGAAGGFAAGYYWRKLMENRSAKIEHGKRRDGAA